VSREAHIDDDNTDKGFGDDIKQCRENQCAGFEDSDGNEGIGDARASDEADKNDDPGKAQNNRDEDAGNPDNDAANED
jgi:hypothetical protein